MCSSAVIPDKYKGKKDFCEVTIIIPGPKEPKNLDTYLEPLLEDLKAYGPDGAVPATPILAYAIPAPWELYLRFWA